MAAARFCWTNGIGLVFPEHNASACAAQVFRLLEDQVLYNHLRRQARRAIEERFEIEKIMDRLETSPRSTVEGKRQAQAGERKPTCAEPEATWD